MALGVNGYNLLTATEAFVTIGSESFLEIYQWWFRDVVSRAPTFFGVVVVVYELLIATLMLMRGDAARTGVIGTMLFLMLTSPMNLATLPNVVLAIALVPLMSKGLERGVIGTARTNADRRHDTITSLHVR